MFTKQFPANTKGRDFVVGDLHGCFTLFQELLLHIGFNSEVDRMFSVGDLVDRGPENMECVRLIDARWFHAVKANHEELMLDFFSQRPLGVWWVRNGGGWQHKEACQDELLRYMPKVDALPFIMSVELPQGGRFHVVHADLDSDTVMDDTVLMDEERFTKEVLPMGCMDGLTVTWGRALFGQFYGSTITDLDKRKFVRQAELHKLLANFGKDMSPVFCGHTPMKLPTQIGPMINIDTRAFAVGHENWAGLTVAQPATGKFWKNFGAGRIEEVQKVVLL